MERARAGQQVEALEHRHKKHKQAKIDKHGAAEEVAGPKAAVVARLVGHRTPPSNHEPCA
jgi:hypothetical protein